MRLRTFSSSAVRSKFLRSSSESQLALASPAAGRRTALAGRRIVVTRPIAQSRAFAELIRARGGAPLLFPTIEIVPVELSVQETIRLQALGHFDLALFVSANAVEHAMALLKHASLVWPLGLAAAAVGAATARALTAAGVARVLVPQARFDSEALLEMPDLQHVDGRKVVLFRGVGGRELLSETLIARGATLERIECYARRRPQADAAPLLALWRRARLDAVTASSSEGLRNFYELIGPFGQTALRSTPVFVSHARIAATAHALGCERVNEVDITQAGDHALVDAMSAFFQLK